jgi:hypothetical protein
MLELRLKITGPSRGACRRILRNLKSKKRGFTISGSIVLESNVLGVTTGPEASSAHQSGSEDDASN